MTGGAPHTRILSFAAAPPAAASHNPHATSHLSQSRQYVKGAGARAGGNTPGSTGAGTSAKTRRLPQLPDRVLDAPGFVDDYYLNLISWSCTNKVAIALGNTAFVWDADSGDVVGLHTQM